jgi:molecular chaperone DnaK
MALQRLQDACEKAKKELSSLPQSEMNLPFITAESHAEEDKRKFELAEARNQAEHLCFQVEKMMREHADKLNQADRAPLKRAIEKTREAIHRDDIQAIRSATDNLEQASHGLSKMLYERPQAEYEVAEKKQGDAPAADHTADDAIDAEYEVRS